MLVTEISLRRCGQLCRLRVLRSPESVSSKEDRGPCVQDPPPGSATVKLPPFDYVRPDTVADATARLAELGDDAKVLNGGQSLLPMMALRLSQPAHLVDISRIDALKTIDHDNGYLVVGAGVSHATAERDRLVAESVPLLFAALPYVGHRAIRTRGTVVGSIAHGDPAAEAPSVAVATDAQMVAVSVAGERVIPASEFFVTYLTTALEPVEILTAVRFPIEHPGAGWSVLEVSRRHGDFAMVGVVTRVGLDESGTVTDARLVFFGVAAIPWRAHRAEQALIGGRPEQAAFDEAADLVRQDINPADDLHASAEYRRHVAGELALRSLAEALSRVGSSR